MKTKQLREKKIEDMSKILEETTARLQELRFKDASGQVKNVREMKELKKTVARIKTLQRQQELGKNVDKK
ncbi:50S ribosomal protein L29 [Candidatus Falkowbacteria bacterium CG10_big_fil_rev_8_21_14_0_10_39_11]|uniref:Large ribosomal subunit protein uL29 n=1 Tax=Candidatus Falkowbacteria bacterium CG10_big_fil_rev_8_21_14_0_10_39_11 TaxID=1974565 RepID=A0A2H0V3P8_9BACT|nr:MAG: 50S ribosomal protein L29 [Candidatus Falkowbacteria bacterium CG10_big_fil_rev_8_21_14_0_10_39_11]